jgi:hypothetical protein
MAKNTKPVCSTLKPYTLSNTKGNAAKKAYKTAKLKATYRLKTPTIGSVTSMWIGRRTVTVRKNLSFAVVEGKGLGGGGRPRFLRRRRRRVFLYVSWVKRVRRKEKMAKKTRTH